MIKKIMLKNFKCFEDQSFDFKDINFLSGKNGAGKTAVKDAIIFTLYNRTSDGSAQNTDTYIKRGTNLATVEVILDNDHKLIRDRSGKSSKLSYVDFSQSDDDARVAQRDLEGTVIPSFEYFINVFNAGYFMNYLNDKDQRQFIMNLTPAIDREALFKKAGGDPKLCSRYGIDPGNFIGSFKKMKEMRYETKQDIDKLTNRIDYIQENIPEEERDTTIKSILKKYNEDLDEYAKATNTIKAWSEYEAQEKLYRPIAASDKKVKKEINELDKLNIKTPKVPDKDAINRIEDALTRLNPVQIPSGSCPTCLQAVTAEHRDKIAKENKDRESKRIALETELEKENEKFEKLFDERDKIVTKVREKETKKRELLASISRIDAPKLPSIERPKEGKITKLNERIEKLKGLLALKEEEKKMKTDLIQEREDLKEINTLCDLFSPSGLPSIEAIKKVVPIEKELSKYVEGVKLIVMRLLKNGMEYKDTFDIEIKGKRYARLSSGEKKKLDFALSCVFNKFIKERTNQDVGMIFIDDVDLLDSSGKDTIKKNGVGKQLFLTEVNNNNLIIKTK